MPKSILIEVAIESADDAVAAEEGGADRLELCAALDLEGLTPSLGAYLEVRSATRLPIWVMIRPRPGDFVYSPSELRVMTRDIEQFREQKVDGFVFGVLQTDGRVDAEQCRVLRDACAGHPAVFHRAFDETPDSSVALENLIVLGFRRVLTSGGAKTALAGSATIANLHKQAAGRIEVLPGGKIRANNAVEVLRQTGCDQIHGSFAEPVPNREGQGAKDHPPRSRTSQEEVAAARAVLKSIQ